jgi:hypothetical protein
VDYIPPEALKSDTEMSVKLLHRLFADIWDKEVAPHDWRESLIVKLPKKSDTSKCDKWREIILLAISVIFVSIKHNNAFIFPKMVHVLTLFVGHYRAKQ